MSRTLHWLARTWPFLITGGLIGAIYGAAAIALWRSGPFGWLGVVLMVWLMLVALAITRNTKG